MGLNSNIKIINSTTCHCCSLNVFKSIIKNKSIRLCDMRNSNDPMEVIAAGKYIINLIDDEYKKTNNKKYLLLKRRLKSVYQSLIHTLHLLLIWLIKQYLKDMQKMGKG